MTGGKSPRRKGHDFEREIANIAKNYGHDVKRTPCSRYPDICLDGRPVSAKRRKTSFKWIYKELTTHDMILCRDDGQPIIQIKLWKP